MSLEIKVDYEVDEFRLDLDLEIPSTGISAIFGPSGCGKTTLLRILAGLITNSKSTIKVKNKYWQSDSIFLKAYERSVGYVFQEPSLFEHLSVRENILYGYNRIEPEKRLISVEKVIEVLGIESFIDRKVDGLSGGEQQRVAIARALLAGPELLLMDEPLSGLDNRLRKEIMPYMESLSKEFSLPIIYVTHSVEEVAKLADELILMENGQVKSKGPVFEQMSKLENNHSPLNLIEGVIEKVDQQLKFSTLNFKGLTFLIPGAQFKLNQRLRLQIKARDISLTLEKQEGTSILNIFPGTIVSLEEMKSGQFLAKIEIEGEHFYSEITKLSVRNLELTPQLSVFAQVKAASLVR